MYEKMMDTNKNENPIYLTKDFNKVVEKGKDKYFKLMATQKPKKEEKKDKEKDEKESFSE